MAKPEYSLPAAPSSGPRRHRRRMPTATVF